MFLPLDISPYVVINYKQEDVNFRWKAHEDILLTIINVICNRHSGMSVPSNNERMPSVVLLMIMENLNHQMENLIISNSKFYRSLLPILFKLQFVTVCLHMSGFSQCQTLCLLQGRQPTRLPIRFSRQNHWSGLPCLFSKHK